MNAVSCDEFSARNKQTLFLTDLWEKMKEQADAPSPDLEAYIIMLYNASLSALPDKMEAAFKACIDRYGFNQTF